MLLKRHIICCDMTIDILVSKDLKTKSLSFKKYFKINVLSGILLMSVLGKLLNI